MGLFSTIGKLFSPKDRMQSSSSPPLPPLEPEPDEIEVPELTAEELHKMLSKPEPPQLLDVREQYEWDQVHMAQAQHIPMNEIPGRLDDLPSHTQIIVFCAHGQRSYGVAHYLIENGYDAVSLAGGITDWAAKGFEVAIGTVGK